MAGTGNRPDGFAPMSSRTETVSYVAAMVGDGRWCELGEDGAYGVIWTDDKNGCALTGNAVPSGRLEVAQKLLELAALDMPAPAAFDLIVGEYGTDAIYGGDLEDLRKAFAA